MQKLQENIPSNSKRDQSNNYTQKHQKEFKLSSVEVKSINTTQMLNATAISNIGFNILNLLSIKQGKLVKITRINLNGKTLEIQDQFSVRPICQVELLKNRQRQKLQIIKQPIIVSKEEKSYKKNNKNIVKNMIRLFKNWLEKRQMVEIRSELQGIIQDQKTNNKLIEKMALNQQVNQVFTDFLSNFATDEINASKILDKKSHLFAIRWYIRFLRIRPVSQIDLLKLS